jgi:hypothetical protein
VTIAPRPDHTREKSLAQQTEQGPDPDYQRLGMLYELVLGLHRLRVSPTYSTDLP